MTEPIERKGVTVHIHGEPTLWLESPIATRPEDWAPRARVILFGHLERMKG